MATNVILIKEFDAAKISYGTLKTQQTGTRSAFVNYDGAPLILQLPLMSVPFPINDTGFDGAPTKKFEVSLSFRGIDTDPRIKAVYDKLEELEEKLVADGVVNSLAWLKKKNATEEWVAEQFTPIIKREKDKETGEVVAEPKYPPMFKVKLPYDFATSTWSFPAYDLKGNEIDFATVKPNIKAGARARLLIQLTGLWFSAKGFGASWKVYQGQFEPVIRANAGLQFRPDEEDDEDVAPASHEDEALLADLAADAEEHVATAPAPAAPAPAAPVAKPAAKKAAAPPPPPVEEEEVADAADAAEEDEEEAAAAAALAAATAAATAAAAKKKAAAAAKKK